MGNNFPETAKPFTIEGEYNAKCIDVYDGDTITMQFQFRGEYNNFKIRVKGVDCPEIKPKKSDYKDRYKKYLEKLCKYNFNNVYHILSITQLSHHLKQRHYHIALHFAQVLSQMFLPS